MGEERIQRARAGDREALAELLEGQAEALRARLARRLPEAYRAALDVEDVLQVSWLEAFLRAASFSGSSEEAFAAWLRAIAEHNLQDALRELAREKRPDPRRRLADPAAELLAGFVAHGTSPTRAAARAEARELLEEALRALPEDYARVVRLYDLEGRDVDQTAAALGRSRGAVHMLRARAHERLRERLGPADRFPSRPD